MITQNTLANTKKTLRLYPKSPRIPSFTIPYISPLIQFTWRSEWKRVSEFGYWVHRKDCRFCIVCLLFNNHLKRAAPGVRLKDLSWTLSWKLCINNLQLICTCVVLRRGRALLKYMNGWFSCGRHLLAMARRGNSFGAWLSQCIMGIL